MERPAGADRGGRGTAGYRRPGWKPALLTWLLPIVGCEAGPPPALPPTDPALRAEIGIDDDVPIHRIDLAGREAEVRIVPHEITVRSGEVLQLVALDHRVYLIVFERAEIGAAQWEFLLGTGQDSPAPLVERGSRLVFTFEGAPAGSYPFRVESGGSSAPGVVHVEER